MGVCNGERSVKDMGVQGGVEVRKGRWCAKEMELCEGHGCARGRGVCKGWECAKKMELCEGYGCEKGMGVQRAVSVCMGQ